MTVINVMSIFMYLKIIDASEFEESESVTLRPREKHLSGLRNVIQKSAPGPG